MVSSEKIRKSEEVKDKRPKFKSIKSVSEFESYYWYREELKEVCKEIGISSSGAKADLEERLKSYLKLGPDRFRKQAENSIDQSVKRKKKESRKITLDSKVILEGIRFDSDFREFCRNHYRLSKFNFTKAMAEAVRDAEKQGNLSLSVKDLLYVYENPPVQERADDRVLRWNRFVKEFHSDLKTAGFANKLRIAAFLWKKVRDRRGDKKYNSSLLDEFAKEIRKLEKSKY